MTQSAKSDDVIRWVKRKSNYKFCFYTLDNTQSSYPVLQPQNNKWPGGNEFAIEICGWSHDRHSSVKNLKQERKAYSTWRVLLSGGQYILVNVLDITDVLPVNYESSSIETCE